MRISCSVLAFLVLLACGGGGDGPTGNGNDNPVNTVTINGAGSGTLEIDETRNLSVTLRDVNNAILTGRTVNWTSAPAGRVTLSNATGATTTVEGVAVGTVTVTATSEGKSGSVNFNVVEPGEAPLEATVNALPSSYNPTSVTIKRTGTVTWVNNSGQTHDLTFDNPPAGVTSVDPFNSGTQIVRTFNSTGNFDYHCTKHAGMNGTVVVVP